MTTLKDISEKLGLSVATVSRALNGFPEVNAATRERVMAAAAEMNYQPNALAQKLVGGRSGMFGMIVRLLEKDKYDQSFIEIMMGLSARLAERDIDLVFKVSTRNDILAPYKRMIAKNTLDGFILNGPSLNDPRIAFLQQQGVPFVVHGRDRETPDYAYFDVDNFDVSAQSVNLLADLGHKGIMLLNGPQHFAFADARRRGFVETMRARGLDPVEGLVVDGDATENYGYTQALAALSGRYEAVPTAFVCVSTTTAEGVYRAVRDKGLRVGTDVSVVSHDDADPIHRAANFSPALTVTRAPMRDACAPLAEKLIDLLEGKPAKSLQTTVRAELILRDSTGPAPNGG